MCKKKDLQILIFENLVVINKCLFDYAARITLTGFLLQIGLTVGNDTIQLISVVLFILLAAQIVFNSYAISDRLHDYTRDKISIFWLRLLIFAISTFVSFGFVAFVLMPAIEDVFRYYMELAVK